LFFSQQHRSTASRFPLAYLTAMSLYRQSKLMKRFLYLSLAVIIAALLLPPQCVAQYSGSRFGQNAGPYFRVGVGPAFTEDGKVTEFSGFAGSSKIDYDVGSAFEGAIGFAFNEWVSAEFQAGWIANEIDSAEGFASDDTFLYNAPFLANVTFQHAIPRTYITPYIGAGVGGSVTGFDTDFFSDGNTTLFGSDEDVVFAYQFFAGARFDFNRNMSLGVGYKYFATEDSSFRYDSVFAGDPSVKLGIDGVRSHLAMVSFTLKF
jgi:opacity protein-like surface antigen